MLCLSCRGLIVSAHPYCARKFTPQVKHRAHARNKMKMTGQMAIAMALPGFNDLVHLVITIFLLVDHFLYQFSTFCEKKMWKIY